jgi:OOP family OmpA-OmpF porin
VAAERLATVGRGEGQPIAPNTNPDGTDNPEGRAMNRRAELKVQ